MGICLHNKEMSMDMGYGSFKNLRNRIALLFNKEFGNNYVLISYCNTSEEHAENDKKANKLIEEYGLDTDIVDFLYQSDCKGKITPKTCKKLHDIVKDYDDDHMYGYVHANHSFSYFKNMLKDCYTKHRNLYWY